MKPRQTKMCVYCLKRPATEWLGYVRKGKEWLTAGWCKRCDVRPSFCGHWRREMGCELTFGKVESSC